MQTTRYVYSNTAVNTIVTAVQTSVHPKFSMCSQLVEVRCAAANLNFHQRNWNSLQIAVIKIPWALPSNWIQLQKYLNRISKFYSMQVTDWRRKIYLILMYLYLNFILKSSAAWCWLPEAIRELLGPASDIHQELIPLLQERHWNLWYILPILGRYLTYREKSNWAFFIL